MSEIVESQSQNVTLVGMQKLAKNLVTNCDPNVGWACPPNSASVGKPALKCFNAKDLIAQLTKIGLTL